VEELWRRTSYFVRQTGSSPEALMPFLDRTAPPSPWYSLAIQPGERQLDPGSRRAVEDHGCGYVLLNRHPLSTSRLDSAFLAELPALGERVARFGDPGGVGPAYDPLDAYFIPLGDFGELRQPGPEIEVWQLRGPPSSGSRLQSGRQRFAAAFMRAARSMLEEGKAGDFLELAGRACDLDPALADAPFHVLAGRACAQLGGYRAALDHCQQALALDPGNEGALQLRRLVEGR
jgi:tetratricopeptide (TPR) repeat protein